MQNVSRKMQNVSRKMQNVSRKTQDAKYKAQNARYKTQISDIILWFPIELEILRIKLEIQTFVFKIQRITQIASGSWANIGF